MALIQCGECKNEVSDRAAACPRCGCPINQARPMPMPMPMQMQMQRQMSPEQQQQAAENARKAQGLVNVSHIFGWGGLGMIFVIAPALGIGMHSGTGAVACGILGAISAVVGAIIGQVGRGMQGRVI